MSEILREDPAEGVALIRMNAPERRNAFVGSFARDLAREIRVASADEQVAALVLTGGLEAFCAGAHRDLLVEAGRGSATAQDDLAAVYDTFDALREARCVTVAAVCGPAVGAGLNLVLASHIRVVAHDAYLRSMFMANGIHPGGGHLKMLLTSSGMQTAMLMAAGDAPISGDEAVRLGLAYRALPAADVEPEAIALASRSALHSGLARAMVDTAAQSAVLDVKSASALEGVRQRATLAALHA